MQHWQSNSEEVSFNCSLKNTDERFQLIASQLWCTSFTQIQNKCLSEFKTIPDPYRCLLLNHFLLVLQPDQILLTSNIPKTYSEIQPCLRQISLGSFRSPFGLVFDRQAPYVHNIQNKSIKLEHLHAVFFFLLQLPKDY